MENSSIMEHVVDKELFERIRSGDEVAFQELFTKYWELLYRLAYKILRDEGMAEDMVQEVFISVWERRKHILNSNIKAYLSQSVKFQVFKQLKKSQLQQVHIDAIESITLVSNDTSESDVNIKELTNEIETVLGTLPNRCREIFYMSRSEQLTNKEIATRLGISIRTVETQISIALKHLRNSLSYILILYMGDGML